MRPPWFEATAALSAAGHSRGPPSPLRFTPLHIQLLRGLAMTDSPYAFVPPRPRGGGDQPPPVLHPSLSALADAVERRRDGRALQLIEVEDFELDARPGEVFTAVQLFALNMGNDPEDLIGTAWLNGRGRTVLEPALSQARIRAAQKRVAA